MKVWAPKLKFSFRVERGSICFSESEQLWTLDPLCRIALHSRTVHTVQYTVRTVDDYDRAE